MGELGAVLEIFDDQEDEGEENGDSHILLIAADVFQLERSPGENDRDRRADQHDGIQSSQRHAG